jgi:folate-dependent phosphoribosylglycinamide formyltransferase PurN
MHILSPSFLDLLGPSTPIINLHPALPGAFDGADAIGRAYAAFQKGELENGRTGVMVHRVVKEVDRGEPLVVREVPVKEGESLEELEARIHSIEHELIVEGARKVLEEIKAAAGKKDASATSGLEETLEKLSVGGDEKKTVALEKEKKEEEKETSASQ